MNISLSRRLKVNRTLRKPCVEWTGHCNTISGHGQRWDAEQKKVRGAHVMAWEEANGCRVPSGMLVRHRCDNPSCVEWTHLVLGTHRDNRNDMLERHPERYSPPPRYSGERHPMAKLTDRQVAELREKYTGQRGQRAALAREYGVTKTRVGQLLDRRCRQV